MKRIWLLKFYLIKIYKNLQRFLIWTIYAVITGLTVGAVSIAFVYSLNWATSLRKAHTWFIFFLPLAGVFIVFLYRIFKYKNDKGTNLVLSTIHLEDELPFKMAPLIFISTVITHLFGGSAGREGAALQLGGSIGSMLGKWFKFDEKDKRVVIMCGMSAAFSAIFGTPVAAAIFSMEVVSVGVMYYAALVPCVFASFTAIELASFAGIHRKTYSISSIPSIAPFPIAKIIVLALLCAFLSVIFCMILHNLGDLYRARLKNQYIRIIVSSAIIIVLTCIVRTDDYMGVGIDVISRAIEGKADPLAFLFKMIFTALTLEAGFKGGEIIPSFFVGATFGCVFGSLLGISPSLCAGVGMIAVFCGVTNCPVTSMLIAFELFGYKGVPYFIIAISVSYLMSGYYGLYHDQTIVYSKYKTEYVNRRTRE